MTQKTLLFALCTPLLLAACGGNTDSTSTKLLASSDTTATSADHNGRGPHTLARCYTNPLFLTEGASFQIDTSAHYGDTVIAFSDAYTVKGKTTFNGYDTVQTDIVETEKTYNDVSRRTRYENTTATARVLYGEKQSFSWQPDDTTFTFSPPVEIPLNLGVNQTFEQTYISNIAYPWGQTGITTTKYAITFRGFETVKVPAGTFRACKVEEITEELYVSPPATPNVRTEWVVASGKYAGFVIKASEPAYNFSFEATDIKIDKPRKS